MNERNDSTGRWGNDPFGILASDGSFDEWVSSLLSEPSGVVRVADPTPEQAPSLPGLLDSRLLPPQPETPARVNNPPTWSKVINAWAAGWSAEDSTEMSARDIRIAAERLNQQISDRKLVVHPDVEERLEALNTQSKLDQDRPVVNGRVFYSPFLGPLNLTTQLLGTDGDRMQLSTTAQAGFELRTCCPDFMAGDTHTPDCHRTLEKERRMVPGNRAGGYDDGPEPVAPDAAADDQGVDAFDKYIPSGVSAQDAAKLRSRLAERHIRPRPRPKGASEDAVRAAPYVPPPVPDRLQIGHVSYTVTCSNAQVDKLGVDSGDPAAGYSDISRQSIVLREDDPRDYQAQVLLHEVLHQCLAVVGADLDADGKAGVDDMEERAVRALSGPLLHTLRTNPALVAYLTAPAGPESAGGQ